MLHLCAQDVQGVKVENKGFLIVWMLEQEKNMKYKIGKRSTHLVLVSWRRFLAKDRGDPMAVNESTALKEKTPKKEE